jgi:hypothetical protein
MKTIVRPSFWAFLNLRPAALLPVLDPRFVAFQSATHRLLYAPPQLPQDAPDVAGVIIDCEVLFDQVGHSLARPQWCLIPQTLGTLVEQLD